MKNAYLIFYEQEKRCLPKDLFINCDMDKYQYIVKENNNYCLRKNIEIGKIDLKEKFAFLITKPNDLYINSKYLNDVMNEDIVLVERFNVDEAKVIYIVKRALTQIIGTVKISKKNKLSILPLINNKKIVLDEVRPSIVDGHVLLLEVIKITKESIFVKYIQTIGHKNQPDIETLKIVAVNNWPTIFSEDVLNEINNFNYSFDLEKTKRKDLTNLFTITIDSEDAKDLDDAISFEIKDDLYQIGIHIADVSFFVKDNGFIDKEAFKRSNSLYLADRVIPMLPEKLSNDLCSLNPEQEKLAVSLLVTLDKKAKIINYELFESIIKSNYRLTYNRVNDYLDNKHLFADENLNIMLTKVNELSQLLNDERNQQGQLNFKSTELKFVIDENYVITDVVKRTSGTGENLIESLMLLTNEIIGKMMTQQEIPTIYRIHETPDLEKITEAFETLSKLGFKASNKRYTTSKTIQEMLDKTKDSHLSFIAHMILLRSMKKAKYFENPIGHFGLALKDYLHFTAPIRRYSDLYVHRIVKSLIINKNNNYLEEYKYYNGKIEEISKRVSEQERLSLKIERDVLQLKACEYLSDKIYQIYDATITSLLKTGMFVELDNGIEGFISLKTINDYLIYDDKSLSYVGKNAKYLLGQKVKVRLINVDLIDRKIDFEIITNKVHNKRNKK